MIFVSKKLKEIHTFEFPEVVLFRTKDELGCTDEKLEMIKYDFFDYMYTVQKYKTVKMLSKDTDCLWHNLILHTRSYADFCENYVGFFVHHEPYIEEVEVSADEKQKILQQYKDSINDTSYITHRRSNIDNNVYDFVFYSPSYEDLNDSYTRNKDTSSSCSSSTKSSCSSCGSSCSSSCSS